MKIRSECDAFAGTAVSRSTTAGLILFGIFLLSLARSQTAQVPQQPDSTVIKHYLQAVDLFNEHDDTGEAMEEARKEFLTVIRLDPKHAPATAYLGLVALEANKLSTADSFFQRALNIDSTCPEAHVGRARLSRQKLQWQAGYDEARLAVRLAPTSIFARWELVSELIHRSEAPPQWMEAIPHLEKILALDSLDREAHLNLAQGYEDQKRYREAAIHYRAVLRIGQLPEDMDVWVYTVHQDAARCFENFGDYGHAIEDMKLYLSSIKEFGADKDQLRAVEQKIKELQQKSNR